MNTIQKLNEGFLETIRGNDKPAISASRDAVETISRAVVGHFLGIEISLDESLPASAVLFKNEKHNLSKTVTI